MKKKATQVYLNLLVITVGFSALAYLFRFPYLYVPAGLAALSALYLPAGRHVARLWEKFGRFLGKINSRILLGLFFIFVIVPFSVLYRLGRKKNTTDCLWNEVGPQRTDFNKPY